MMRLILASLAILGAGFGLAPAAFAQSDVSIAVVGPMTGEYASFGAQFKAGAEAAVADIDKAGGVLGKKLKLEIGDDVCDPKQARSVASQLAAKNVLFVAGHYCSGSSIPASDVYNEAGIVQISPGSTNPKYTDLRPKEGFSYRICGRDDQQGSVAGIYLAKNFKDKNIAIVHDKTAYGKGLAEETKKAMNAAGKMEVFDDTITAGEKDYSAVVTKLKDAKIDLVFLGGYHTEAGYIIRQMRAQGMKTILMGGDALVSKELGQIAGPDVEGTLLTFSPDPRKNPAAAGIVAQYKAKNVDPEGYVLYAYAAVQTWKGAVEKAQSFDPMKVKAALDSGEFDTVLGKFKFDGKGDPSLVPYVVYKWNKTDYEQE
ncbi:MAG: branched-chain amino acid ABC transporter substrate-binding protein [Rhodomicrobium sp.]